MYSLRSLGAHLSILMKRNERFMLISFIVFALFLSPFLPSSLILLSSLSYKPSWKSIIRKTELSAFYLVRV